MSRLLVFYRLLVRPVFREPVRTALTVLAIALGVAMVLAIELAGNAATNSFHSSMETLAGDNQLEIVASGGVPEEIIGRLTTLPFQLRISPRIEDFASFEKTKRTLPLLGLDLIGEGADFAQSSGANTSAPSPTGAQEMLKHLADDESIYVGSSLGFTAGQRVRLLLNDQTREFIVRGVYPDSNGNESAIVMDIGTAQRVLNRFGRVDRILIKIPAADDIEQWQQKLHSTLPGGVNIRPQGAGTVENRKMLAAFRWNLRLLSYISLVVGAFLIYNAIAISVVRRRAEIGITRALGASRTSILAAFISEAACFGLAGSFIGLPLGRLMSSGAVRLMGNTVNAIYVSSRPGEITLTWDSVLLAILIGVGVAIASAYSPAREASLVSPIEAMARGRREFDVRVDKSKDLYIGLTIGLIAAAISRLPAIAGKPLFGYLAAFLLIVATAFATPFFVDALTSLCSQTLKKLLGVEALLASRSLRASLRRTSVLVGALSTAIAMVTSVGIMVGSFRETVVTWMGDQLPADLYIRPAGNQGPDRHPTISLGLADQISRLPGVAAVDRLRAYEIEYDNKPVTLASVDFSSQRASHNSNFFSGRPTSAVLNDLNNKNAVIVSEPFTNKHHVQTGDSITLNLGAVQAAFRIADVYYDYSSERGNILMDRQTMLRYLPDPAPSNIAVYVAPGFTLEAVRAEIEKIAQARSILIFSNRDLRGEAIRIFDRTFAITYALEAVAVFVAVMGVLGALLALVIDRRRELGLLRFLGAASEQIRKLILVEAGLIGLLSNLAGLALGFAMSLVLIFVINKQSFGWTIQFHLPIAILLGALTIVFSATVLAGLYPARVAIRMNPLEVVHED